MSPVKATWWQLYAALLCLMAALLLEQQLALPQGWHQVIQVGSMLVFYGFVHLWLRANALALSQPKSASRGTITVYEFVAALPPEDEVERLFHLPEGGLRNTLGDTVGLEAAELPTTQRLLN